VTFLIEIRKLRSGIQSDQMSEQSL